MRFMMFIIPQVYQGAENLAPEFAPSAESVANMMKYNEELATAGALISMNGLMPPSKGARVSIKDGVKVVTDGPFAESKEVIGGYWIIQTNTREEALDWATRVPFNEGDIIEIRQIFEMTDFPEDVQDAANNPVVIDQLVKHL